jgi:CHAD domain-containing protein
MLLARLARALKQHLPSAVAGEEHGVHQARVASRRLREAVPVLATGLKGSKARKAASKIRRLTQALGSVRELDVTLALLDELARAPEVSRTAVEDVRTHVVRERAGRREVMLKRIDQVDGAKLDGRLASVAVALQTATTEPWRKALGGRLVKRSKRLIEAMDDAGQMYAPERLHAVRIAAKKLRYGLELAADSGLKQAAPHVRTLKQAQDMLGRLHDFQVLLTHVAAAQNASESARPQPRVALQELARYVEDQCRHLHGRYVALAPDLRDATIGIRKIIVPQLVQAPKRRRVLKMALPKPAAVRTVTVRAASGGR